MIRGRRTTQIRTTMMSIAAGVTACSFAGAQGQGGTPPPPPPQDPLAIVRPITAVDVPLQHLQQALSLTKSQGKSVGDIQKQFMEELQKVPQPAQKPLAILQTEQTIAGLETSASSSISALLTDAQSQTLAGLLADANDFREVGIPLQAVSALKLTTTERTAIATDAADAETGIALIVAGVTSSETMKQLLEAIGLELQAANANAVSELTAAQQKILAQYLPPPPQH